MTLNIEDYRRFYADEIRFVANLDSPALVEAFARVPREKFIGPGPWQVGSAEVRALAAAGIGRAAYVPVDDPRTALTTQALFKVRSFRREPHEQEETCLLHGKGVCFSSAEVAMA